ncbi:hypothetical protein BRC87_12170 [Halobacteriales archaeon QS_4_66_20]|nr:MAG: hypothetical protein BRC87_12170 [Halobacteriales archaeon QS_4_66_20]
MSIDGEIGDVDLSDCYHVTFDPDSEPGSDAVVSSLAEATGTDPDELEPIELVVDPIIFNALVRRRRRPIQISFVYHEHHVTVDTGGEIWIQNSGQADRSEFECIFDMGKSPSHGVIQAVATVKGVEPIDLDPLCHFINPDALDAMFDDTTEARESDICVSFRIEDSRIEVSGDRRITVRPVAADA